MSGLYKINLIRERVARRRLARARQRVAFAALSLLGVLLFLSMSAYLARQHRADALAEKLTILSQSLARTGFDRGVVQDLNRESLALSARLSTVSDALSQTTSWPGVLTALADSVVESHVVLNDIQSVERNGEVYLLMKGYCREDNPPKTVHGFLNSLGRTEVFDRGVPISIREGPDNRILFDAQARLSLRGPEETLKTLEARRARRVARQPDSAPATEAAHDSDGGGGAKPAPTARPVSLSQNEG